MKHIFYFIGLLFIYHELLWIINPMSMAKSSKKIHKYTKGKSIDWDNSTKDEKSIVFKMLFMLMLFLWMLFGLFTFNWLAFLFILIFNVAIMNPISKPFRWGTTYVVIHWINSIIGFAFGLFVIINSYHLKIDLLEWFISLFK